MILNPFIANSDSDKNFEIKYISGSTVNLDNNCKFAIICSLSNDSRQYHACVCPDIVDLKYGFGVDVFSADYNQCTQIARFVSYYKLESYTKYNIQVLQFILK